jgi:hypothetical protein
VPVLQGGIIKQVPVKIQSEVGGRISVLAVGRERVLSFLDRGRVCVREEGENECPRGERNIDRNKTIRIAQSRSTGSLV